ncbi:hypothetical protein, conserved [Trypanosoma brucei gambiense DAL972]|uniref:Uncharacterized protein n=2 Tax=Trypanosoma brucei TaxID=5691 RepID=D0A254_TRYB9|nr:hypothetical protein, conserved [Trypanosoma brucei gambiense DAL972]RHW69731.1 Ankyrin repeats (3 copies) [Trypanosoma brucei equiperdum]CBH15348.1 hypothetical protein, conserved [Trypanosoma brucei gambiense DAL972]|eukprot:XP_011777612.1 hypothetical protein, conserved [Trypanosoma brucei gambiense DAL972]
MLSPIVDMKSVGTDDGFDIYLPGSDAFYFKRQLHYQPYTPCAFPVEWLGHQGKMHKTSVHMRISPSNLEEACASGSLGYVIMFWAQGQNIKGHESVVGGGDTLLMTAAYKGHIHVVRFLVDAGADINATNSAGFSALHMAASAINYHIVRFLLDHGADPTKKNHQGYSAYCVAVQNASLPLLLLLAEHRPIDIHERDEMGHALLHWAAYNNSVAICQYLVEVCKMDINVVGKDGRTALVWAAREGYADVVEYLLCAGADVDVVDTDGYTALNYAKHRNHPEVQYVLENYPLAQRGATGMAAGDGLLGNQSRVNGGYVTAHNMRCRGTFSMLYHEPFFAAMSVLGAVHVLLAHYSLMLLPPLFSYAPFGMFFFRNTLWMAVFGYPVQGGKPELTILQQSGIGRSFSDTIRGTWRFRDRDAASLFALTTFMLLQLRAWALMGFEPFLPFLSTRNSVVKLNTSLNTTDKDLHDGGSRAVNFMQPVMCFLTLFLLVSVVLCKLLSMRSVYKPEFGSLVTSPVWNIIKHRAYNWLHPRIIFMERHLVLPLRAFYCYEKDVVMERYDGYSAVMDCPVAASNHAWFFIAVFCFMVLQWLIFISGWRQARVMLKCPRSDSLGEYISSSAWNLLVHALPCRDPMTIDVTGKSYFWVFMFRYIIPTTTNRLGVWLLHYSLIAAIISTYCFYRQLVAAAIGATRMELANRTATSGNGGLVSIFPPSFVPFKDTNSAAAPWTPPEGHCEGMLTIVDDLAAGNVAHRKVGSHCIYADSRFSILNIIYFLLGISGRRWRGAVAVSSFNSPISSVSLLEGPLA